eukprot:TRINITY_DN2039_c0_g1_i2.p1 TRINITY_DN2039_c0_g1~~TRINITY_DN2039_c0_g1_i2.p1  ORF type:complete len:759 (+),score=222.83 TRINITY_DN2039_c0_g1_i2:253-2529(+)
MLRPAHQLQLQLQAQQQQQQAAAGSVAVATLDTSAITENLHGTLEWLDSELATVTLLEPAATARCTEAAKMHASRAAQLHETLCKTAQEYKVLDDRINTVGSAAVRIAERLEGLDQHQQRAQQALELLAYFGELNVPTTQSGAPQQRSAVFTDAKRIAQLVRVVKQLTALGQELADSPKTAMARVAIEGHANQVENSLLQSFEKALDVRDAGKMKEFAALLYELNGGESCLKLYIQKQDMFFDPNSRIRDESLAKSPVDCPESGKFVDPRLDQFYEDVLRCCAQEWLLIQKVFFNAVFVMSELVRRIIEERITDFVGFLLQPTTDIGVHLRVLNFLMLETRNRLISQLGEYNVGEVVAKAVDSMLKPYQDSYIAKELSWLQQSFQRDLGDFNKKKKHFTLETVQEGSVVDLDSDIVTLEVVLNLIHATKEACTRCCNVSYLTQIPGNCSKLFLLLLDTCGTGYFDAAFTQLERLGISQAAASDTQAAHVKAIHVFFRFSQVLTQAVVLLMRHFNEEILPLISSSANDHARCNDAMEQFLERQESKVVFGLNLSIDSICKKVASILEDQKKSDYKVKESEMPSFSVSAAICSVVEFVSAQYQVISRTLDGQNLDTFLDELGLRLHAIVKEHLMQVTVSPGAGGMQLMRDLVALKDMVFGWWLKRPSVVVVVGPGSSGTGGATSSPNLGPANAAGLNLPASATAFEQLVELTKVFVLPVKNLGSLLSDSPHLNSLDAQELLSFVKLRSDYEPDWLGKHFF